MAHTLEELVAGFVPIVVEETRGFWEGTLAEELRGQRCGRCDHLQLPGGPCCRRCWSQSLTWEPLSGRGSVFAHTIVRHAFHPSFADQIPYVLADIELDEGPIFTSNVTDVDVEAVSIGMAVEVWFDDEVEDAFHAKLRLPRFRPRS